MRKRPGPRRTSLLRVLLGQIQKLEVELAIARAESESAHELHRQEYRILTEQCETLASEAMMRQVAQQRAERRLIESAA